MLLRVTEALVGAEHAIEDFAVNAWRWEARGLVQIGIALLLLFTVVPLWCIAVTITALWKAVLWLILPTEKYNKTAPRMGDRA